MADLFKNLADMFKKMADMFKKVADMFKKMADMFKKRGQFSNVRLLVFRHIGRFGTTSAAFDCTLFFLYMLSILVKLMLNMLEYRKV